MIKKDKSWDNIDTVFGLKSTVPVKNCFVNQSMDQNSNLKNLAVLGLLRLNYIANLIQIWYLVTKIDHYVTESNKE